MPLKPGETVKAPSIRLKEVYNPFSGPSMNADLRKFNTEYDWQIPDSESFRSANAEKNNHIELNQTAFILPDEQPENLLSSLDENIGEPIKKSSYQLHKTYILSHIKTGFLIIDFVFFLK